jgi:hypothetical protein
VTAFGTYLKLEVYTTKQHMQSKMQWNLQTPVGSALYLTVLLNFPSDRQPAAGRYLGQGAIITVVCVYSFLDGVMRDISDKCNGVEYLHWRLGDCDADAAFKISACTPFIHGIVAWTRTDAIITANVQRLASGCVFCQGSGARR